MASKKKLKKRNKKLKAKVEALCGEVGRLHADLGYWRDLPRKTIYVQPGGSIADAINEPIVQETIIELEQ